MALLFLADNFWRTPMNAQQFEPSSRPAVTPVAAPPKESDKPDVDPARQHAAPDDSHGHDEPGYGHGA